MVMCEGMRRWIRKLAALALAGAVACAGALPAPAYASALSSADLPVDPDYYSLTEEEQEAVDCFRYWDSGLSTVADSDSDSATGDSVVEVNGNYVHSFVSSSYFVPSKATKVGGAACTLYNNYAPNVTLNDLWGLYGYGWSLSTLTNSSVYLVVNYVFAVSVSSGSNLTFNFIPTVYDYEATDGIKVIGLSVPYSVALFDSDSNIVGDYFYSTGSSGSVSSASFSSVSSDVSYIALRIHYPVSGIVDWCYGCIGLGLLRDADGYIATLQYPTVEIGLLNGIIAMLQSIWEAVSSLPALLGSILDVVSSLPGIIAEWFSSCIDAILSLPQLIMDGIYNLFVPSQDDLSGLYDDFEDLMTGKLGAVWQVFDIVLGVFQGLMTTSENGSIHFPGISVNLPEGLFVILPESDVAIWPDGFGALEVAVRTGVTAVIVLAWCNGLLKKMGDFLGDRSETGGAV